MDDHNPAATGSGGIMATTAAPGAGGWRDQLHPTARTVIISIMLKALKKHLPMSDPAGQVRLQKIAVGIEKNSFNAATNRFNYFRNISVMMLYVESPYQNHRQSAPGLPSQGNHSAHSPTVLMSQQQAQKQNTSTSAQSSHSSPGECSTDVSQTSVPQSMAGQSSIQQMQSMVFQLATRSGSQQSPFNTIQQPVTSLHQQPPQCVVGQQRYPQPSVHEQPSLQQTQPNLHQNQLICQQYSTMEMQQPQRLTFQSNNIVNPDQTQMLNQQSMSLQTQHPDSAAFSMEDYLSEQPELSLGDFEFSRNKDNYNFSDREKYWLNMLEHSDTCPLFSAVPGTQDEKGKAHMLDVVDFNEEIPLHHPKPNRGPLTGGEIVMVDSAVLQNEKDGWSHNAGPAAWEDPNCVSMTDMPTNLKKRKYDSSSSSFAPMLGQPTFSSPGDLHASGPVSASLAMPEGTSTRPS